MAQPGTTQEALAELAEGFPQIGRPDRRADARLKVTGEARYAADEPVPGMTHAALVTSKVAKGRITGVRVEEAMAIPGVRLVLTHENRPKFEQMKTFTQGGQASTAFDPMSGPEIKYHGQIVAVVVADTLDAAREAADLVHVEVAGTEQAEADKPFASILNAKARSREPKKSEKTDHGDLEGGFSRAAATVSETYVTPVQHHNPIELYATTAEWQGGSLLVHLPSQWVVGTQAGLAGAFGLPMERVRVLSPYVGGGFGSKATVMPHTWLVAAAARMVGRPVRLVVSRDEMFTVGSFRPAALQKVRIAGDREGRFLSFDHEQTGQTSRFDEMIHEATNVTTRLYGFAAAKGRERIIETDTNTPGFMRAPAEVPGMFGLESAVDELAWKLGVDPVELRLRNDSQSEPVEGTPWSSRSFAECLRRGSEMFGWSRREARPASMRRGDELIGYGVAMAFYPTYRSAASARLRIGADGSVRIGVAASDLGTGLYTVCTQVASEALGLAPDRITVQLGDTELPGAPVGGGSNLTASVGNAVLAACKQAIDALTLAATGEGAPLSGVDRAMVTMQAGRLHGAQGRSASIEEALAATQTGIVDVIGQWAPKEMDAKKVQGVYKGQPVLQDGFGDKAAMGAFGAQFVEVAVDRMTGEIRVPRMVGVFAAGRIVNERTARSQLMGGMIWGIGAALHEATEIDDRYARFVNRDLAEYHVPVSADAPDVRVEFVEERDTQVNPLGVKGVGELGIVGVNAAIANGVYHATGLRVRTTPIRIEDVLPALEAI